MTRPGAFLLAFLLAAPPAAADAGIDALSGLLGESRASYESVNDYKAVFVKQERSKGALGPRETIFLKFEKPFKIFMRWVDTHKEGLQVLYERGRHDGKLAIHKPGLLLGLAPVVFLEQSSPWVREGSEKYNIEDAGIGTFLADFSKMVATATAENKIRAEVTQTPEGTAVDASFPGSAKGGDYFAARVTALFDARTRLPVRMSLYDWQGNLTGTYEYNDITLNVGSDDPQFKQNAHKKLYKLYFPPVPVTQKNNFARR